MNFSHHSILVSCLLFQFYCFIYLWAAHKQYVHRVFYSYYATKKSVAEKKARYIRARKLSRKKRAIWTKKGRTDLWWKNMFDGVTPDDEWKRNFRMSKERFFQLCEELRPYISEGINTPNYRSLSREKKLAITLYYLKDTGSIWMTANAFGVHQCTVSKIVLAVCNAICIHLCPIYLHLPQTVVEMRKKVAEFETRFGMTQAFGCIDGTHIPKDRWLILKITSIINSFSPLMFKLFVIQMAYSWMLTAGGLAASMMQKYFQTHS